MAGGPDVAGQADGLAGALAAPRPYRQPRRRDDRHEEPDAALIDEVIRPPRILHRPLPAEPRGERAAPLLLFRYRGKPNRRAGCLSSCLYRRAQNDPPRRGELLLHVSSVGLGTVLQHFATFVQPLPVSRVGHPAEGVNGERRRHSGHGAAGAR